jgi:hypothetical protein
MSSDPLHDLELEITKAAHRQALVLSLPRRPRRRFALALACILSLLVVTAVALAASGLLSSGAPVALPPGLPVNPDSGLGVVKLATVRLLPVAVPDPGGGPPWGLRYVATTRGLGCLQTGRLVRGMIGVIGEDDAFANDGAFHALPADFVTDSPFPCGTLDARGHAYGGVSMFAAPASGLVTQTSAEPGCERLERPPPAGIRLPARIHPPPICPSQDERTLYFGMAGPDATSVTYLAGGKTHTLATVGSQGAYLIVLASPGPGMNGFSPLPGAGGGPIERIDYRNGYVCSLKPKNHDEPVGPGTDTCPHVGQVPIRHPDLTVADVASPVTVTVTNGRSGKTLVIGFVARLAITDASSEYSISIAYPGREPRCGSILSGPLLGNIGRDREAHFDESTDGCHGTFTGTISYRYGENTSGLPFDIVGPSLTVGRFTVRVS